jgi:hypothetical protein
MLAARQEILFHELALTATFTTVVATTLLLGLKARGTLHIGDLINVLLLAGTADQRLLGVLGLRPATATATATGDGAILVVIFITDTATVARLLIRTLLFVGILMIAARTATATSTRRRLALVIVVLAAARFVIDGSVGDVIQHQIFFDLFDFRRGTTFLRIQSARTAGTMGRSLLIVSRSIIAIIAIVLVTTALLILLGITGATATATRRTLLLNVHGPICIVRIIPIGILTGRGNGGQHRLLEQQRRHRTRTATLHMPLRQHLNGIQRTFVSRFLAMLVTRVAEFHVGGGTTTATRTTGRTVVIVIHGTTTTRSLIIITFIVIIRATTANRTGFDLILGIRGTTATANRTHRLGLVPRLRILGLRLGCRQLWLLEQRGRGMLLDLEFKGGTRSSDATHHTTAATTATRSRNGGICIC